MITVLYSHRGALAKTVKADGTIKSFQAGMWFSVRQFKLTGAQNLFDSLSWLQDKDRLCVIRGRPLPCINQDRTRKLCDRAQHGDAVTFEAQPVRWLAIDLDGIQEPPGLDFRTEPEAGAEHCADLLPPEFQDVSFAWQATGSAGIKSGIRARLWFWLSRVVEDEDAKGWLQHSPVDLTLYGAVTNHYTAPPVIEEGARDPMIWRFGVIECENDTVAVPEELPRFEKRSTVNVEIIDRELTDEERAALKIAFKRSRIAREIWSGYRDYPDRSTRHFAFAAALARAGVRDPDTLHQALIALDDVLGMDLSKIARPDYAHRTIGAALAAEPEASRGFAA